jgi:hypothetical protein
VYVLAVAVLAGSGSPVHAGLVAHWSFNEGSGDTVYDSSGNGHNGHITGAVWTEGLKRGALQFDADDDFVEIGINRFDGDSGTIAGLIYVDSLREQAFFCQNDTDAWGSQFGLFVHADGTLEYVHDTRTCRGALTRIQGVQPLSAGEWYHVAVVSDGMHEKLYVNAAQLDTSTWDSGYPQGKWFADQCDADKTSYIGRWHRSSDDVSFKGKIDELCIYDRALDSSEIVAHHFQCTRPQIIKALASDNQQSETGIDGDDFVVLTFDHAFDTPPEITAATIDSILPLSNGHTWLDVFGNVGTVVWNGLTTRVMITLSTTLGPPTIETGDSVQYTAQGKAVKITGDFGPVAVKSSSRNGQPQKDLFLSYSARDGRVRSFVPATAGGAASVNVYDMNGTLLRTHRVQGAGEHTLALDPDTLGSGIRIITLRAAENLVSTRAVLMK